MIAEQSTKYDLRGSGTGSISVNSERPVPLPVTGDAERGEEVSDSKNGGLQVPSNIHQPNTQHPMHLYVKIRRQTVATGDGNSSHTVWFEQKWLTEESIQLILRDCGVTHANRNDQIALGPEILSPVYQATGGDSRQALAGRRVYERWTERASHSVAIQTSPTIEYRYRYRH